MHNLNARRYFKTDIWEPMPMVDRETLDMGLAGGEGTQWQLSIELDPVEGKYAFMGTDVGGIYKSSDSGKTWTPATIGWTPCGATGVEFDPNNINRVIAVGANSIAHVQNGLYISEDCGESWKSVLPASIASYRDFRHQVAFDASSYSDKIGGSAIAYWSRVNSKGFNRESELHPALFKSVDGGYTWVEIPDSECFGGSIIKVNPENGDLYIANDDGFFVSHDGALTFNKLFDGPITSFDTILSRPGYIYITKNDGLYISENGGENFTCIKGENFPEYNPKYLRVSPANPERMLLQDDKMDTAKCDDTRTYYSHDGGRSWHQISRGNAMEFRSDNEADYRHVPGSWIPFCIRQCNFAWHPTDENVVLTFGGDFVMRSTDGGKSFKWSNSGYTGIMTGGKITLNVNHPDWFVNTSQDYNAGYTLDGGKTFKYIEWLAPWGGFTYGGYVMNPSTVVVGLTDHGMYGRGYQVWTTHNGGKTVENSGCTIEGYQVGMGVPGDERVAFMGEWRTEDEANTFTKMDGCTGVFCFDREDGTLYGANRTEIVCSTDKGVSWRTVAAPQIHEVLDMAFDSKRKRVYITAPEGVFTVDANTGEIGQLDGFPIDSQGNFAKWTIDVDAVNTDIVYIGCRIGIYETDVAVVRSLDAAKTWTVLTRQPGDGRKGPDGAREASALRVHPITRKVIVGTCCRGVWTIPGPDLNEI